MKTALLVQLRFALAESRVGPRFFAGLILSFATIVTWISQGGYQNRSTPILGILLIIYSSICWPMWAYGQSKRVLEQRHWLNAACLPDHLFVFLRILLIPGIATILPSLTGFFIWCHVYSTHPLDITLVGLSLWGCLTGLGIMVSALPFWGSKEEGTGPAPLYTILVLLSLLSWAAIEILTDSVSKPNEIYHWYFWHSSKGSGHWGRWAMATMLIFDAILIVSGFIALTRGHKSHQGHKLIPWGLPLLVLICGIWFYGHDLPGIDSKKGLTALALWIYLMATVLGTTRFESAAGRCWPLPGRLAKLLGPLPLWVPGQLTYIAMATLLAIYLGIIGSSSKQALINLAYAIWLGRDLLLLVIADMAGRGRFIIWTSILITLYALLPLSIYARFGESKSDFFQTPLIWALLPSGQLRSLIAGIIQCLAVGLIVWFISKRKQKHSKHFLAIDNRERKT